MVAKRATTGDTYVQIWDFDRKASEVKRRIAAGDLDGQVASDALEAVLAPLRQPQNYLKIDADTSILAIQNNNTRLTKTQVRALYGAMQWGGWMMTLGDFAYVTDEYLMGKRNFGPTMLEALRTLLDSVGVELGSKYRTTDCVVHRYMGPIPRERFLQLPFSRVLNFNQGVDEEMEKIGVWCVGDFLLLSQEEFVERKFALRTASQLYDTYRDLEAAKSMERSGANNRWAHLMHELVVECPDFNFDAAFETPLHH